MPTEEGLGPDADQRVLPDEEAREKNHRQTSRVGRPPGFNLPLQVESQLFTKEDVFGFEGCLRTRPEDQISEGVLCKIEEHGGQAKQGQSRSHATGGCHGQPFMSNPAFQIDLLPRMPAVPNFCGAQVMVVMTQPSEMVECNHFEICAGPCGRKLLPDGLHDARTFLLNANRTCEFPALPSLLW